MKEENQVFPTLDEKTLTSAIEVDPYNQKNGDKYLYRSTYFSQRGDTQSAISDLSKSLFLEPNLQTYFRRGKLYASSSMFVYALMDFQEADRIYRDQLIENNQSVDQTLKQQQNASQQAIQFLQKSIVMQRLPEIKQLAKKQEKQMSRISQNTELNQQFAQMMNQLIEQKLTANNSEQQAKYLKLLQIVQKQDQKIKELQKNIEERTVDYQQIFYKEMESSTMSENNKDKCKVYYNTVLSELEEYYLAAKVLHDIDEKKLKFQDYQDAMQTKKGAKHGYGITKNFVQKLFKVFQKHSSKLQRAGEIVKEIPYIGTAFKLIKSAVKGFTWFQDIKIQSQCDNILQLRPTVTSFNIFAAHFGYELYRFFKIHITTENPNKISTIYERSNWQKIAKGYKNFRKKQIGAKVFNHISQTEKDYITEMGQVHASIVMVGVAYGFFKMPHGKSFPNQDELMKIIGRIEEIQQKLLLTKEDDNEEGDGQIELQGLTQAQKMQQEKTPYSKNKSCSTF